MTPSPETPDSEAADNIPRLSRRAIALGSVGVLAAGVAVAIAGFVGGSTSAPRDEQQANGGKTQQGQLGTLPLHDEKPMRGIGKGWPGVTSTPAPSSSPAPTPTP